MKRFWKMRNYSGTTENRGELQLYGPISETSWWGDEVTPKQFKDELLSLGDVAELDVRINSGGGDVFAAHAISSMLKNHKAKVNVYIDGIAASAATIVASAGDTVYIPPNAMMMIHNPLAGLMGMYNADELDKMINVLEKVKASIVAAYVQKTGMEEKKLGKLMDAETWMTGAEAVEMKFADVLLEDQKVQAAFQNGQYFMNNIRIDTEKFLNFPVQPPAVSQSEPPAEPVENSSEKETQEEDGPLTVEELKNKHPEIYNQVHALGVEAERTRIKDIEDLGVTGHQDIIQAAKFTTGITAERTAMEIIKADKAKGGAYLANRQKDIQNSGMDGVEGGGDDGGKKAKASAEAEDIAGFMNQRRGIK